MAKSLIGNKINAIKKSLKTTDFYLFLDVSKATYSNYLNGTTKPDIEFLMRLSNKVARSKNGQLIDMNWLIDDFDLRPGPVFIGEKPLAENPVAVITQNAAAQEGKDDSRLAVPTSGSSGDLEVPVVGEAAAATNGEEFFYPDSVDETFVIPMGTCTIRIHGQSMEPLARNGQKAFLRPYGEEPVKGDLVAVWTNEAGASRSLFKRWVGWRKRRDGGDELVLESINVVEGVDSELVVSAEDFGGARIVSGVWYG